MAATYNFAQSNGASPGAVTELNIATANSANYKNVDDATPSNYSANPITANDSANNGNSYEVWLRGHWTGTFTTITNLKFWRSVAFSPATGLTDKYGTTATYVQPTKNDSTAAATTMPTSTPGSANIGIGGSTGGTLSSAGYSDYIVLQLHIGTTAAPGDTSLATYTLQYDET